MLLGLRCPGCKKRMSVPESAIGRRVQCPRCRHVFRYSGQRELTLGRVKKPKAAGTAKAVPLAAVAGVAAAGAALAKPFPRVDRNQPDTVPLHEMELLLSEAQEADVDIVPVEEFVEVTPEEAAELFEPMPGEPEALVAEHEVESLLVEPEMVDFVDVDVAEAEPVVVEEYPPPPVAASRRAPIAPPTPPIREPSRHQIDLDAILNEEIRMADSHAKPSEIPDLDIRAMLDEEIAALPLIGAATEEHLDSDEVESASTETGSKPLVKLGGPMPLFDPNEISRYFQQPVLASPAPPQLSPEHVGPPPRSTGAPPTMIAERAMIEAEAPVRAEMAEPEAPIRAELADDDVDLARLFESEVEPLDADIVNAELAEPIVDDWPGVSKTKTRSRK